MLLRFQRNTYFAGTILTVCIVQIPQRFINVNDMNAFQAGARLLPFGAFIPAGSTLAATLMGRAKTPPMYILIAGGLLEIVGTICLSRTPTTYQVSAAQYGFQILAGTGVGFFNAVLILLVPIVLERRDLGKSSINDAQCLADIFEAVGTGAIAQFRFLGGVIGLAIVTSVLNRFLTPKLLDILPPDQVHSLLESTNVLETFSEATQMTIRSTFGDGYNLVMKILVGFAVAQLPATLLMWKREPIVIPKSA